MVNVGGFWANTSAAAAGPLRHLRGEAAPLGPRGQPWSHEWTSEAVSGRAGCRKPEHFDLAGMRCEVQCCWHVQCAAVQDRVRQRERDKR